MFKTKLLILQPDSVIAAWCPLDNKSDRKCYQTPDSTAKNSTEKKQLIKTVLFGGKTFNSKNNQTKDALIMENIFQEKKKNTNS